MAPLKLTITKESSHPLLYFIVGIGIPRFCISRTNFDLSLFFIGKYIPPIFFSTKCGEDCSNLCEHLRVIGFHDHAVQGVF